jgi:hypothetical protein
MLYQSTQLRGPEAGQTSMVHRSVLRSRYLSNDSTGKSLLPERARRNGAVHQKHALERLRPVPAQKMTVPHLRYRSSSQDVNAGPAGGAAGHQPAAAAFDGRPRRLHARLRHNAC